MLQHLLPLEMFYINVKVNHVQHIYLSHIPYFYIIQHIPSGKYYGGSKWKEGCHPDTFMTLKGYQTNSKYAYLKVT